MKILIWITVVLLILFGIAVAKVVQLSTRFTVPEELNQLTGNRAKPDTLYGWRDSTTGKVYIDMHNWKK